MGYMNGLAAYYNMSTINLFNLALRGYGNNNGTGVGLVATTDLVPGIAGGIGTKYNGSGEYTTIPGTGLLDILAAPLSIFTWTRVDSGSTRWVISKNLDAGANMQYGYFFDSVNNRIDFYLEGASRCTSPNNSIEVGSLHFMGYTWDGTTVTPYIDAVPGTTGAYAGSLTSRPNMSIARRAGSANTLDAAVDESMIFDSYLTNIQVSDLFLKGMRGAA